MSVKWGESFATGVDEIDQQHQELFARLDMMLQAVEQGAGHIVLQDLFAYLDSYTHEHFAVEESLQREINYPHFAVHCEEHKKFINNLERLKSRVAINGPNESDVKLIRDTLVNWLITHICSTDRHFGDFVKEQHQALC
jgi:hemerythrin